MTGLRTLAGWLGVIILVPFPVMILLAMIGVVPSVPEAFGYFGGIAVTAPVVLVSVLLISFAASGRNSRGR